MTTTEPIKTKKLTSTVGAEVLELDCDRLAHDESLPQRLMEALEEHSVLVFRGLHIDDETQVAFCKRLGDLVVFPSQQIPEVFVVTLDPEKNPLAGYVQATIGWHFDDTVQEFPSKATMLSAKVIAAEGGETEFASTYAAYDDLSVEEKQKLAPLRVFHSQEPFQRLVYPSPTAAQLEEWRSRSRVHPLVWTHASGRKSLVLSQTADYALDMDSTESRVLLDDLLARATRPDRVYRHIWSEGDTIMWDNLAVVHRVRPYDRASRRELHRTAIVGTEPIQ
jgi:alpha-ketoglutarate-dependent taurine dioxygenase